jgi:hypothetical protein
VLGTRIRGDAVMLRMAVQWPEGWDDADLRRSTRAEVFRVHDGVVVNIRDDGGRPVSPTPWCSGVSPPTGCAVPGRQGRGRPTALKA